jgi:hypothetical protein
MRWSSRPRSRDLLVEMEEARSIGMLDQNLREVGRVVIGHLDTHNRAAKWMLLVIPTLSALLTWGATEFRGRTTAEAMRQCEKTAADKVLEAKAEHSEFRAANKELVAKQVELDRELQRLAMWRLEQQRKRKPR